MGSMSGLVPPTWVVRNTSTVAPRCRKDSTDPVAGDAGQHGAPAYQPHGQLPQGRIFQAAAQDGFVVFPVGAGGAPGQKVSLQGTANLP
jgi:hypothetical protein